MMMINFAPTSLSEIRPSGETFDRVKPGMSRVVARFLGVDEPEKLPLALLLFRQSFYLSLPEI